MRLLTTDNNDVRSFTDLKLRTRTMLNYVPDQRPDN